ncbi:MAG TPA: Wzz/FepE/Etk N-terminal domain-containing protein [bacterium]|nr:Wzz/FepE/Etk N-terminal domain-containing protein [bacterium]
MNGNDTGGSQISSREILTVIFRRRVPIIVCGLIVTAAALSAAARSRSVYDATAKVLVKRTGATALATSWTPFYALEEEMNTEVQIVTSQPVIERAVQILNEKGVSVVVAKKKAKTSRPPTTDDLAAGVSAEPLAKSNIMFIRFRGSDPKFVGEADDAIANAYVEYRVQVRKSVGLDEYFGEQIGTLENKLLDLSKNEMDLRMKGRVYDLEWQQRVTLNREFEIHLELNKTTSKRVSEEGKLAAMKARMAADPGLLWPFEVDTDDHFGQLLLTDYWNLHRERDEAAAKYTAANPQVKILDDRLAKMEQRMREETQRRMRDKEFLIEDLKATETAYQKEIDKINADLVLDPDIVAKIDYLQRQIQYTYMHYDKVLEKMLDTMASEANDIRISNAKVISSAEVRLTAAGQMKMVYVVFSVLLGLTLGVGFGFLLENLDHSVKSASDIEDAVGVPLLGSIPETRRASGVGRRAKGTHDGN